MKDWPVTLVSAFGRAETLALALHENGFRVEVIDLTPAFPPEYRRGPGPFPIVNKTYLPAQRDLLKRTQPLVGGLTLWLKDGPLELTGPMAEFHAQSHPELKAWQQEDGRGDFTRTWLGRWLKQWASPIFNESWQEAKDTPFPAAEPLALLPVESEEQVMSFEHVMQKSVTVHSCTGLRDVRVENQRLLQIEVDCGRSLVVTAEQWIWCLSSYETQMLNPDVASKIFYRGALTPEWSWLSFEGSFQDGPWTNGLPPYVVVIGDVYLPWAYSNAAIFRRLEGLKFRVWIKVPRARGHDIDARRGWALGIENNLRARLPQAEWSIDSSAWAQCPHSEVFAADVRHEAAGHWKNWDWISAENLPRLDLSVRLEREAASFARLNEWRNEQIKKQGVPRDPAIHAP